MSKSKPTKEEERAELEYYEKTGRLARWKEIERIFNEAKVRLSTYIRDYCGIPRYEYGEEYRARVSEESALLSQLLEGVDSLNSTVLESVAKYAADQPKRPNHLP